MLNAKQTNQIFHTSKHWLFKAAEVVAVSHRFLHSTLKASSLTSTIVDIIAVSREMAKSTKRWTAATLYLLLPARSERDVGDSISIIYNRTKKTLQSYGGVDFLLFEGVTIVEGYQSTQELKLSLLSSDSKVQPPREEKTLFRTSTFEVG